jgi:hypothetical protein
MSEAILMVLFYKPPPNDPFVNRAVAWVDGPYSHVEVVFPDGVATSIYAGESVFLHYRRFANPNYDIVSLSLSKDQMNKARKYCEKVFKEGVKFDGLGMYCARLPTLIRKTITSDTQKTTFCSKYVSNILKHIGVDGFQDVDPAAMSPSFVHRLLMSRIEHPIISTTRYKLSQLVVPPTMQQK